ncbi:MAG: GNAT family N-acetyltransferase [Verrucomicrobiota bacterium]|nr:GNAT family N-acetyltransferase [Verrucomicrobiota bacterium]
MNPSPKPLIRKASFSDGHAIYERIKAHPNELVPRSISNIMLNIDRFLVAELEGQIVGTAAWAVLPELDPTKNPSIEIQSVSVRKDLQKQHLGRKLVEAAMERVAEFQPDQIIVLTFTPHFFAKLGFVSVSKETLMYKLYKGCMNCAKYASPLTCPEVAMAYQPARKNSAP